MRRKIKSGLPVALAAAIVLVAYFPASASAGSAAPAWAISAVAAPTNFSKANDENCEPASDDGCDSYTVSATNVGSAPSSGRITIRDELPPGIVVEAISREEDTVEGNLFGGCIEEPGASTVTCADTTAIPPGGVITIGIEVKSASEPASLVTDRAEVEGGGAPTAVTAVPSTEPNTVNSASPPAFGLQDFSVGAYGPEGTPDVQAGSHPATLSTTINYTTLLNRTPGRSRGAIGFPAVQDPKTEVVDLPLGFVGDPLAAATCPQADLIQIEIKPKQCPAGSVVGQAVINLPDKADVRQIYNVTPESGYPAEFAFEFNSADVYLRARVLPTSSGYVLSVSVPDVDRSTSVVVDGATITFFGDPSEYDGAGSGEAFLTNPDDCAAPPLKTTLEMDSWVNPERWVSAENEEAAGVLAPLASTSIFEASASHGVTGCSALQFEPSVQVHPQQTTTDTPAGYEVDLKVPQARNAPGILATPDLKNAVVRLPEGVSISPSAANGLQACQASGPEGIELGSQDKVSGENKVQEGEEMGVDGLVHAAPGHCPQASQIGEVEVLTPVLAQPLHGHVYVSQPLCGGEGQHECTPASAANGELYGLYLEIAGSGVIVKLKGNVSANPTTGQLTTSFTEAPQFPFSELKLRLNGGSRAPLANPQSCGTFTATSDLTPWSTPETPDATPFSTFAIDGCGARAGGIPFNPGFLAQTTTPLAGAFSPFTVTFSRHDGEQDLSGLTVEMPPGLLGKIAGRPQCPEAAANAGTCASVSPGSQIGTVTAAAGAGPTPYWQSGPVYLTGPYNGAPFGLAVVVPAKAGPYNLGDIVVRAAIHINPSTAAVTVVSNPFPQMIDGVPLRVQTVNVTVGSEGGFTFNPTNCSASAVTATISSAQGASAKVSTPFAVTGCASLPFKPELTASTAAKTSKVDGASLVIKVAAKPGEADIAKTDLQLPLVLPTRNTTLQKACTEAQFALNPAGCPEGADIGTATVKTPLLNAPLTGPMYLVSHGGAAFPDVEIILQGEGVEIVLDGKTDIKKGITYSNFETLPDAPLSSFEAMLPEGPHSAFTTEYPGVTNLCAPTKTVTVTKHVVKRIHGKSKKVTEKVKQTEPEALVMPTTITGQNGVVVKQNTKITVSGCPKAKPAKKAKATATKSSRKGRS